MVLVGALAVGLCLLGLVGCASKALSPLNLSAAVSVSDAMREINRVYEGVKPESAVSANFAASGVLQTQVQNGAPTDVIVTAGAGPMDALQRQGLLLSDTRRDLLHNTVVLIVPTSSTLGITGFADLARGMVKRVALGDPASVPAGTYGEQALDELGLAGVIKPKLIIASDVRQVLAYVESGNVDAGVVYLTDARVSTKVKVVARAPDGVNARVVYPVAVVKSSSRPAAARDYVNFLFGDAARAAFTRFGFEPVTAGAE